METENRAIFVISSAFVAADGTAVPCAIAAFEDWDEAFEMFKRNCEANPGTRYDLERVVLRGPKARKKG